MSDHAAANMGALEVCALCPRLCRHACPVATVTGLEAAVPSTMAELLLRSERGEIEATAVSNLCVNCGGCERACHIHTPWSEAVRPFQQKSSVRPGLGPITGNGELVAVMVTDRPWHDALARHLGTGISVCRVTPDGASASHAEPSRNVRWVVADGRAFDAVREHVGRDATIVWLHQLVDVDARPCCRMSDSGRHGCCGRGGPLAEVFPSVADRMRTSWDDAPDPRPVADARCASENQASVLDVFLARMEKTS